MGENIPETPTTRPVKSRSERRKLMKQEKKRAKKERIRNLPRWRKVLRVIRKGVSTVIVLGVLATGVVAAVVWHKYGDTITTSVTEGFEIANHIQKSDFNQRQPTIVYDANGKVVKEFKQYDYEAPAYKDINPYFLKGAVAVEDKRFYIHHGVDLYGTIRSVASIVTGGDTQGGSTLTQQLVRNVILQDNEVTIDRKIKEQVVAQEVEKKLSKQEILRDYLNNVYFGHGNYGIGPAAEYYFGKDQSKLTVDEVAVIVGITNNPSVFDPITHPDNALNKRNRVLRTFLHSGIISQKEYNEFSKKPIQLHVKKHNIDNRIKDNDALSFAIHKATEDLMEANGFVFQYLFDTQKEYDDYHKRYNEEYEKYRQKIMMGGYKIDTSINPKLQNELKETVKTQLSGYTAKAKNGLYQTELAITTVDNKTGEVAAIVGGRGEDGDYFNRAFQGVRQPGSSAKPLVAYGSAFELGYRPQSTVIDSAIKNGPHNWYSGYRGAMTVRYALEQSVNTVAYKLANQAGTDMFMDKLERMQFAHLAPEDANPIIAIGGFTKGVTTVEMAGGYSTFTRDGDFIEPTNIREIKDVVTGKTIYKNKHEKTKVFQEDAAYFMIDSLKSVIKSGTGKMAALSNYPYVFGKTGTTNSNKDSYFVGATPYYTTAVWVGHDAPSSLSSSELNLPKILFREWMEDINRGKKVVDFKMPKSVYRSGSNLYSRLETYSKLQATREANEEIRLEGETKAQRKRLALEDYRIIYHLTSKEEKERETKTEDAIQTAQNFVMKKVDDYDSWVELIEKAKKLNEDVKHQAAKDAFSERINDLEVQAAAQKEAMIKEIERQKEEQKRLEEAKKKEEAEIASMQKELQTWMDKVNNGDTLTEDEFAHLEELEQKLQDKGVEVPKLNVEWIEPQTEEETTTSNETSAQSDQESTDKETTTPESNTSNTNTTSTPSTKTSSTNATQSSTQP